MILSESEKVEKWKQHCLDILGYPVGDVNSLLGALLKVLSRKKLTPYFSYSDDFVIVCNRCIWNFFQCVTD